jgi:tetratricopeptide (TPR) repeat protein
VRIYDFKQVAIFLFLLVSLFQAISAQKTKPTPKVSEKEELEKALLVENPSEKIESLKKFLERFPNSGNKNTVLEALAIVRIGLAEEKLKNGLVEESIQDFKTAISEFPANITDEFFTKNVLKIPNLLFFNGQQVAGVEIAGLIEEKIAGNATQLCQLATFYLNIEDGESAKRLAEKAVQIDEKFLLAYLILGLANRLNFDLDASVKAYEKALEIAPNSVLVKQNLADMKRALGQAEEALKIYQEILQFEPESIPAKTGLVLSLFDLGKIGEAEAELEKAKNSKNFVLLAGIAYWYARESLKTESSERNEYAEKAAVKAQEAIEIEPRYVWAYIALARSLLAQNKPNEAEKVLLTARQYGNFPTLDYELAVSRLALGFYNEAVEALEKSFSISNDGLVETRLGNRITKRAEDFSELLSFELRAGIFHQKRADSKEEAQKLKALFLLTQKLKEEEPNEAEIIGLAEDFVRGDDKAKVYRSIFVAERLMEKKIALSKALDFVKESIGGIEQALEIPSASSFVLSDQLYEARRTAISRGQLIIIPQIPRQTLSNVMRGKIEEIMGWTLYQRNKISEAIIHLKRAVSILPEDSAWWRSSLWRLGACYEANGDLVRALDAYVKSYKSSEPNSFRKTVIENLYRRIYGNLDGLEDMLQAKSQNKSDFLIKQTDISIKQTGNLTEQLENQVAQKTDETSSSENKKNKDATENLAKTENDSNKTPETEHSEQVEEAEEPKQTAQSQPRQNQPKLGESESQLNESKNRVALEETKLKQSEVEAPILSGNAPMKEPVEEKSSEQETKEIESQEKNESEENSVKEVNASARNEVLAEANRIGTNKEKREIKDENIEEEQGRMRKDEIVDYPAERKESVNELMRAGQTRPRIVRVEVLRQRQDCGLFVSQEEISILRDGGSLGVLVGYIGADEDLNKIIAIPDSLADVKVEYEPEVAKTSKQLFLVIKSIGEKTGIFKVLLKSPCGNKEIKVRVK